jgi:hypothetical protein
VWGGRRRSSKITTLNVWIRWHSAFSEQCGCTASCTRGVCAGDEPPQFTTTRPWRPPDRSSASRWCTGLRAGPAKKPSSAATKARASNMWNVRCRSTAALLWPSPLARLPDFRSRPSSSLPPPCSTPPGGCSLSSRSAGWRVSSLKDGWRSFMDAGLSGWRGHRTCRLS